MNLTLKIINMQYTTTSTIDNNNYNNAILVTQWCSSNTDEVSQYNNAYNSMMAALYSKINTARIENTFVNSSISHNSFDATNKSEVTNKAIINSITTYCN
jgi:hypothetical protein